MGCQRIFTPKISTTVNVEVILTVFSISIELCISNFYLKVLCTTVWCLLQRLWDRKLQTETNVVARQLTVHSPWRYTCSLSLVKLLVLYQKSDDFSPPASSLPRLGILRFFLFPKIEISAEKRALWRHWYIKTNSWRNLSRSALRYGKVCKEGMRYFEAHKGPIICKCWIIKIKKKTKSVYFLIWPHM